MRGIINDLLESVQTIKERATLSRILLCSGSSLLMRLYWFTDKNIPMFVEVQIHKDSIWPHHVLFTYLTLNTKFRPHNEVNVIILSAVTSACGFWANSSAFFFFLLLWTFFSRTDKEKLQAPRLTRFLHESCHTYKLRQILRHVLFQQKSLCEYLCLEVERFGLHLIIPFHSWKLVSLSWG